MPKITEEDATATILKACAALKDIDFDVIKKADDKSVSALMQWLQQCYETYFGSYLEAWAEDYKRREREEMED